MQISYKPQGDRGVTQLMYVGDDDAVEKATAGPSKLLLVAGAAVAAYLIFFEKRKHKPTTRSRIARIRRIARSRR